MKDPNKFRALKMAGYHAHWTGDPARVAVRYCDLKPCGEERVPTEDPKMEDWYWLRGHDVHAVEALLP